MIAIFQHGGSGNSALFLHVLGATVLFGAMIVLVTLVVVSRHKPDVSRLLFRIWWALVVPAFLVMRIAAEWVLTSEKKDIPGLGNKAWVGVGFVVADFGAVLLLIIGIAAFRASRDEGRRRAATVAGAVGVLYLIALSVAVFAMSGKPGS